MSRPDALPFAAHIERLPASVPFVGPEAQERATGQEFRARLGANESLFGPSPRAIEAMRRAASEVWMYGDPESHDLRQAVARAEGVDPANIIIGEGIDGLMGWLCRMLLEPGQAVVTSEGAYPTFNYHVTGYGGRLVKVPYRDDAEDPEALLAAAKAEGARMVYLANPDNPMGSWHKAARIEAMIAALPKNMLLVLDEAYIEFAPEGTAPKVDPEDPRVIRFRTFSKAHGMAGARVGYGIAAAALVAGFDRVRNHFGMCRISQAGALAALEDPSWLAQIQQKVATARDQIAQIARANGLKPLPSATNFVTIDCGKDGVFARALVKALAARGVFVRMPFAAPQDRCIRISCGRPQDLAVLAEVLPLALADLS